jgi:multicomponent Na+:H+ antiporter subunit G
MAAVVDAASWFFLVAGAFLAVAGGIGMLRLPDFYTRMHAASVTDTGGMLLILLGLALQAGWSLVAAKLALIAIFALFTGPTATHALAHAALRSGLRPRLAEAPADKDAEDGA